MHGAFIAVGVVLVLMLIVHIIFKAIKFTISVLFLGVALIAVVYVFKHYFGIDLISAISGH